MSAEHAAVNPSEDGKRNSHFVDVTAPALLTMLNSSAPFTWIRGSARCVGRENPPPPLEGRIGRTCGELVDPARKYRGPRTVRRWPCSGRARSASGPWDGWC